MTTTYTYNQPTQSICQTDSHGNQRLAYLDNATATAFETIRKCVTEAWCGSFITTNEYENAEAALFFHFWQAWEA